jgi:hypothetical protein
MRGTRLACARCVRRAAATRPRARLCSGRLTQKRRGKAATAAACVLSTRHDARRAQLLRGALLAHARGRMRSNARTPAAQAAAEVQVCWRVGCGVHAPRGSMRNFGCGPICSSGGNQARPRRCQCGSASGGGRCVAGGAEADANRAGDPVMQDFGFCSVSHDALMPSSFLYGGAAAPPLAAGVCGQLRGACGRCRRGRKEVHCCSSFSVRGRLVAGNAATWLRNLRRHCGGGAADRRAQSHVREDARWRLGSVCW